MITALLYMSGKAKGQSLIKSGRGISNQTYEAQNISGMSIGGSSCPEDFAFCCALPHAASRSDNMAGPDRISFTSAIRCQFKHSPELKLLFGSHHPYT
jgi:hypothetical protein